MASLASSARPGAPGSDSNSAVGGGSGIIRPSKKKSSKDQKKSEKSSSAPDKIVKGAYYAVAERLHNEFSDQMIAALVEGNSEAAAKVAEALEPVHLQVNYAQAKHGKA